MRESIIKSDTQNKIKLNIIEKILYANKIIDFTVKETTNNTEILSIIIPKK